MSELSDEQIAEALKDAETLLRLSHAVKSPRPGATVFKLAHVARALQAKLQAAMTCEHCAQPLPRPGAQCDAAIQEANQGWIDECKSAEMRGRREAFEEAANIPEPDYSNAAHQIATLIMEQDEMHSREDFGDVSEKVACIEGLMKSAIVGVWFAQQQAIRALTEKPSGEQQKCATCDKAPTPGKVFCTECRLSGEAERVILALQAKLEQAEAERAAEDGAWHFANKDIDAVSARLLEVEAERDAAIADRDKNSQQVADEYAEAQCARREAFEEAAKLVMEGAKTFRDHPTQGDVETSRLLVRCAAAIRALTEKPSGEEKPACKMSCHGKGCPVCMPSEEETR